LWPSLLHLTFHLYPYLKQYNIFFKRGGNFDIEKPFQFIFTLGCQALGPPDGGWWRLGACLEQQPPSQTGEDHPEGGVCHQPASGHIQGEPNSHINFDLSKPSFSII